MRKWPWSSWKKWHTAFLVDTGRYVAYPRFSTTTNFMELGENHYETDATYQRKLLVEKQHWNLPTLDHSLSRYDSYCGIEPDILKRLAPELVQFDLTVDLSGMKPGQTLVGIAVTILNRLDPALLECAPDLVLLYIAIHRQHSSQRFPVSTDTFPWDMLRLASARETSNLHGRKKRIVS